MFSLLLLSLAAGAGSVFTVTPKPPLDELDPDDGGYDAEDDHHGSFFHGFKKFLDFGHHSHDYSWGKGGDCDDYESL